MPKYRNSLAMRIGIFFLLYCFAGQFSIQLGTVNPGNMAVIWLAAGIGLFAVLQLKKIGIAIVFIGSLTVNAPYLYQGDWQSQIGLIALNGILFASFDTLQSFIAARAYTRLDKIHTTQLWTQPLFLPKVWLEVCLVPAMLTMPLFIILMVCNGLIPTDTHSILLRGTILLLSDTSALLLLSPLYPYIKSGNLIKELRRVFWYLAATLPPILINYFVLDRMLALLLPLMLFITVRFRIAATNLALLFVAQLCIGLTARGYGFWLPQSILISLLQIQVFTFSLTLALQYLAQTQTQITRHKELLEIEVQSRTESLAALNAELSMLATTDELTRLPNRREWQLKASQAILQARRYNKALSMMMIDVDHFKKVNDQYGHLTGDMVLKEIAKICQKNIRAPDSAARWGGEEFVVLLPETDGHQALIVADKIRLSIASAEYTVNGKAPFSATVSIGVTSLMPSDNTLDEVLTRADQAMYAAKSAGRNCVQSAQFMQSNYLAER